MKSATYTERDKKSPKGWRPKIYKRYILSKGMEEEIQKKLDDHEERIKALEEKKDED